MAELAKRLNIAPEICEEELIPALRKWQGLLEAQGIKSHLWFIFGSVVKQTEESTGPEDPTHALARELTGARGPGSRIFRPDSDIDVGIVVGDGNDEVNLHTYDPASPFRATRVGGHLLSLTRFTTSWMDRRSASTEEIRNGEPTVLGVYGQVVPIEL